MDFYRHIHELLSGRTSSVSHETLGFDSQGNVINYSELMTAEEISEQSTKLVTFMDLAGHRRYMKTTVQALSGQISEREKSLLRPGCILSLIFFAGYVPHHAMVVVASGGAIQAMTKEHLAIVRALNMSFFIVVTKVDLMPPDSTIQELGDMLSSTGFHKVPFRINTEDDVLTANAHQLTENIVPIFCVSNVTGAGLENITKFLHVLSPNVTSSEKERLEQEPIEFSVDEIFKVAEVGVVCGGLLTKGVITEGTKVKIGPFSNGNFSPVSKLTGPSMMIEGV